MDTLPSENTSKIPVEPESLGPPSELIPVRRSERTTRAPDRLCLNMKVEDDEETFSPVADIRAIRILIAIAALKEVKDYLGKCFYVKDLGEAAYILGIKIYRDRSLRLIGLNQSAYIDKILKKFNMQNSKKGFIPMEVKHDLSNEMCASSDEEKAYMKKVPYASAVGSIMYAVRCTRPDVVSAQNLTGYVFVVNGGAVDWKRKKQTTIAMHATQSENMDASEAAMETVWIRKFVGDLGVMPSINKPINMYCDNSAAIIFANELGVMK
nr:hypothetical protein [Tanacetum cinerariifolium]